MRMVNKIMWSMRDTGLLEGMSAEDCDTLVTAALEAMREPTPEMGSYVRENCGGVSHQYEYLFWIDAALNE